MTGSGAAGSGAGVSQPCLMVLADLSELASPVLVGVKSDAIDREDDQGRSDF